MIKINLLSAEMIKKEERNELIMLAYAVLAAFLLFAGADYVMKLGSYKKLEARISQSEAELVKYESILKQVEAIQATTNVLNTKKNVINTLMQSRLVYLYFMEDILEMMPYNLWFKSINTQLSADGTITAAMDAEALDNYAIADFVSSLTSNQSYSSVELGAITTSAGSKTPTSAFRLSFGYKKKNP